MILSCYQIYLFRIAGSYLPLSAIVMAMCIPFVKISKLKDPLVSLFFLSISLNIISIFWSPVIGLWEYQIVFGYIFFVTYAAFKEVSNINEAFRLVKLFVYASSINALLIIIFRFYPEIEAIFIIKFLDLFKNPDRLGFDTFLNVWDVDKAGGVFDNANTAASLHLVCIGLTVMLRPYINKITFVVFLLLNVIAVICSGSKSALIIMVMSTFFHLQSII
jgi:hypothetical protein